jgi:hypothetical protein
LNRAPHFALRGLYRRAGPAVGVAARLDESETLADKLLVDLARHALVVPAMLERLAAGVDTKTALEGALARLASGPPPQPAGRPGRGRGADSAEHVARAARGMLTAKTDSHAAPNLGQRVQEILRAMAPHATPIGTQEEPPTLARVGRWAGIIGAAVAEVAAKRWTAAPASSPAAARAAFEQWIERAGIKSNRPVAMLGRVADVAADAMTELIAGRMVPTGTLIAAAVATDAAEQADVPAASPLQQSAMQISAVLERIATRRPARGERPPPGVRPEPSGIGSEPVAGRDDRAVLDHAGARVSGLRRLAMRAGAGVRAVEFDAGDAPVASTRREWSGFDRSSVTLPETDDALSRRIADILMRETRRHGVETSGVEP